MKVNTVSSILTDGNEWHHWPGNGASEGDPDSLSGSFQRVQNTLETTFQQIGASIAPAAKDSARGRLDSTGHHSASRGRQSGATHLQRGPAVVQRHYAQFASSVVNAKDSIASFVDTAVGIPGAFSQISARLVAAKAR